MPQIYKKLQEPVTKHINITTREIQIAYDNKIGYANFKVFSQQLQSTCGITIAKQNTHSYEGCALPINEVENLGIALHFRCVIAISVGQIFQSVYRLATGWTVWGSNLCGGEIFHSCPGRPWGPTSLLHNGYRVFPAGSKRPRRDADPSTPSSAEV
jgi:hypothetical protein